MSNQDSKSLPPLTKADIDGFVLQKAPNFSEAGVRDFFHRAADLRTAVITCMDPRSRGATAAIAREFGLNWPGEDVLDENGYKVGHTTNIFEVVTIGGRAADALRSISMMDYTLGIRDSIVVVHHSFCGNTGATPAGIIDAFKTDYHVDISGEYDHEHLSIPDFEHSLRHDVALLRDAPGVPKHLDIFGYVYDINSERVLRLAESRGVR